MYKIWMVRHEPKESVSLKNITLQLIYLSL